MRKKSMMLYQIVLFSALISASAFALSDEHEDNNQGNIFLIAGGLCMGGAVLGTVVVPVIGTVAGCAAAALGGWFWPKDDDEDSPDDIAVVE